MNTKRSLHKNYLKTAIWKFAQIGSIATALLFLQCASNNTIAGNGSQAGNGRIACVIYNSDGTPASGATVRLRSYDYIVSTKSEKSQVSQKDIYTDTHGMFSIDSVDPGSYCIEVNDGKSNAVLLNCAIFLNDTLITIPGDTLKPTGTIKGVLDSTINDSVSLYIRINGLERVGILDTLTGSFTINDIPRGNYTISITSSSSNIKPMEIKQVNATSSTITDIGKINIVYQLQWHYPDKLYLNTSSTGAAVACTVTNFPVLVRLNENNFNFNLEQNNGRSLRFTKEDGTSCPYEIEQWDAVNHKAAIWVKVDTIYGNDSTHFISMHYGNSAGSNGSNSKGVFDTAAGFTGVWHLSEQGNTMNDATENAFNGKDSGSTAATGIIGNARSFSNKCFIKIPGLLNSPQNITLSAWVQTEKASGGQDAVSIGDAVLIRVNDINNVGTAGCYHNDSAVSITKYAVLDSGQYLPTKEWHYLVFSVNTEKHVQTLYIDGVQTAISNDVDSINYTGLGTDTYIGRHGNGKNNFYFVGQIDEVRVNKIPLSSDWIKLCFMNQKSKDALIVFR